MARRRGRRKGTIVAAILAAFTAAAAGYLAVKKAGEAKQEDEPAEPPRPTSPVRGATRRERVI